MMEPGSSDRREQVAPPRAAREGRKPRRRKERVDFRILNQNDKCPSTDVSGKALGGRESARHVRQGYGQSNRVSGHT